MRIKRYSQDYRGDFHEVEIEVAGSWCKAEDVTGLENELATALLSLHGEFCAWDGCGCLERVQELRGVTP
jgi:hypothetical protein